MATVITAVFLVLLLVVNATIKFDVLPESTGVLLGQDLVLNCVAEETDNLPLMYRWEFNGTPSVHPHLPNNSLYVAQLSRADLGPYQCVIQIQGQPDSDVISPEATVVKAYLEDFFQSPKSVSSINGTKTTLECVTGYSAPPAIVHWEKDGSPFTQGSQETGTFGNLDDGGALRTSMKLELVTFTEMEGIYVCTAENPLTRETVRSAAANLTVQIPPEKPVITRPPPLRPIAPSSLPFTLDCGTSGYPPPEIRWHVGDAMLIESDRIQLWTNGSLHFTDLREEDTGSYKCTATNVIGVAVSEITQLTVAVLDLEFIRNPSDINILGGQPVTLLCVPPRSVPSARVVWYCDSAPFQDRQGEFAAEQLPDGSLHFDNIQVTDEGKYFCVAVNDYAVPSTRTSETATVTVQASPIILEPPVPQRIVKGQLLTLMCRVRGRPLPVIHWFKDNEELVSGARHSFQNSRMELLVMNSNKDDEGMYRCFVSNRLGNVSSASVLVFVIIPPEIVEPPQDSTVPAGSVVFVSCRVYGDPTPTITWTKDGKELAGGAHVNITRSGLTIYNVQYKDEGTYQCQAVNEGGRKTAEARLQIQVKPKLNVYPQDKFILENQPLVLHCQASGSPEPSYYWMFNGSKTLPVEYKVREGGQQLFIQTTTRLCTGSYTCVAENVAGTDSRTVFVLVIVPPQITTILGDLQIDQGDDLHLTCLVTGIPQPEVTWSFDGNEMQPTLDNRITFPKFNEVLVRYTRGYNSGRYQCFAENDAGTDKLTTDVQVLETPLPPTLTSVYAMSMTSVNVTWMEAAEDADNQMTSWVIEYKERISLVYKVYRDDIPVNLRSHEVSNLRPFTEYVFRVAAKNPIGTGAFSASLGARTLESAPSQPRNLQMESHNATAVSLRWEVPAETNGIIRAYQVHYRRKYEGDEYQWTQFENPRGTLQRQVIFDLSPYSTYEIRVRGATIEQGRYLWGAFSKPIDITTSATPPSAAPPSVTALVLSPRAIQVSWQPLPAEYHHGILQGYIVTYSRTQRADKNREQRIRLPATQTTITGLLPWRYYDIRVMAYNHKGRGTPSDIISVRTSPEAPTGSPSDVHVDVLSESAIAVGWKPIPLEERNSEISGYVVEYENRDLPGSDTLSQDIGDPGTLSLNITGLLPWTAYRVRVLGFTVQLPNGMSPSSSPVLITTLEGVAGPVQNLTITAFPTWAMVMWEPPLQPNGVIQNYIVTYYIVTPEETTASQVDTDPRIPRRVDRDVGTLVSNNTWEVISEDTNVTITHLQPDSTYVFSVVAVTAAGRPSTSETGPTGTIVLPPYSPPITLPRKTTTKAPTTPITTSTPATNPTTHSPTDQSRDNFPIILGSSIAGAIVLITIAIIVAVCCYLQRKDKKGSYYDGRRVIPPMTFAEQAPPELNDEDSSSLNTPDGSPNTTIASSTSEMQLASSQTTPPRTTSALTQSSIAIREGRPGPSVTNSSAISRPYSEVLTSSTELHMGHSIPLDPMLDLTYSSLGDLRRAYSRDQQFPNGLPHLQMLPPQVGLENLAFDPHGASLSMSPRTDSIARHSGEVFTSEHDLHANVNLSKRRKNRMKSQTAAAIAVQKDATSSMFLDTDTLIQNDSVVIYDERTAL